MDILPKEIESIKTIGNLYNNDVKMIKCIGGFYLAIGKKKKSSRKSEALAAGSHQAIVAHQLSKEYGSDYQPAVFKSEQESLETVLNKTEYLPRTAIEGGIELYALNKGNNYDYILYKHGRTLGGYKSTVNGSELSLNKYIFNKEVVKAEIGVAKAISRAIRDTAYELNLSRVNWDGIK